MSLLRFKNVAVIFIKILLKLIYFSKKKCKFFKRLGLRPQTPSPPAARDFDPRPPASDSFDPRPPKQPNCEFLATRLTRTVL